MPKLKSGLTVSEYAVLGLLARGPDYGYQLQQHFAGATGLALVSPVEPAALYAVLKSLSGLELIDGEWDRSQYPPKAVYSITPEGQQAFERWLLTPVGRIRQVRSDFLVKLYFAMQRGDALMAGLIEGQLRVCRDFEAQYRAELSAAVPRSFEAVVLSSKLSAARITRRWLQQCRAQLCVASPRARRPPGATVRG